MISSFHAVFGLRQRDKSAKVIDYNNQVIRVREYLLFRGIPSPMYFQLSRKRQCTAFFPSNVCNLCLKRLRERLQCFASERGKNGTEIASPVLDKRKGGSIRDNIAPRKSLLSVQ